LDADSDWLDTLGWSISTNGQILESGALASKSVSLVAGQSYELRIVAGDEIGTFSMGWNLQDDSSGGGGKGGTTAVTEIGPVDYWQNTVNAGSAYRVQATQDGMFSVLWQNADSQAGQLSMNPVGGAVVNDATWENGGLRLDVQATAGQWFDLRLPRASGDQGELSIANVLSQTGKQLHLDGTSQNDMIAVNSQNGLSVSIGTIDYRFAAGQINNLEIDSSSGSDKLVLVGSSQADSITLRAGLTEFENNQLTIRAVGTEEVTFHGNGGADSASLYDTDGDDTLTLRPFSAEMVGPGYKFNVTDVDRIFIHATAGGQDVGNIYDSVGDDRLSVRPQFSSVTGPGYYNYISGIERLYAYGTAGGRDVAELYDSRGNDRFSTNGDAASIVGPGFSSYTKFFEQVKVHATAGGQDVAALYGSGQQTQWQRGSDFVSFSEDTWSREARGFERVDAFLNGQAHSMAMSGLILSEHNALDSDVVDANSTNAATSACPAIGAPTQSWSTAFSQQNYDLSVGSHVNHDPSDANAVLAKSVAHDLDTQIEHRLLIESEELRSLFADRLDLPEEPLLANPVLERALLDEVFSLHQDDGFF
jgi:hypothetical protein